MKHSKLIPFVSGLLLLSCGLPAKAQVNRDNDYSVNQVDANSRQLFVPGQVLVKFKDANQITVRKAKGMFRSASINSVNSVLKKFGVNQMDRLFPDAKPKEASRLRRAKAYNGQTVTEHNLDKIYQVKFAAQSTDSVYQLVDALNALDEVEYAEPNYYVYIDDMPRTQTAPREPKAPKAKAAGDWTAPSTEATAGVICANPSQNPLYTQQWGIDAIHVDSLWNKPIVNKKRPVIAILDTGVDINHPDLKDNIWCNTLELEGAAGYDDDGDGFVDDVHGWDFVYNHNEMDDNNSHGTHVAGIAAASDNALGIVGANPQALIMPVKVMDDDGRGDVATVVKGINYAAARGADVISMSLGGGISQSMADALENAYMTSVIVASAGNNWSDIYNPSGLKFPAAYYCVIGVQATADAAGNLAGFSNYDPDGPIFSRSLDGGSMTRVKDPTVVNGINYEVKAPGVDIMSTVLNGGYATMSGTSMSAPLVAGAVSALKMVKDSLTNDQLMTDLAHLNCDFARVYRDEGREPDVYLAGMTIDDKVEGNTSVDGQVDAGETVNIYPTLLNGWANSGEIKLKLAVDKEKAPYITIKNPDIDFGYSLGAYSSMKSKNPFTIHVSDSLDNGATVKFVLTSTDTHGTQKNEYYMDIKKYHKIHGLIERDTTWTADRTWYVTSNVGIQKGATLTIEPGTRVEFENDAELASFGRLIANGTPKKPIVFTGHNGARWNGIRTHRSEDAVYFNDIYTNNDFTVFSFIKTDKTPNSLFTGSECYAFSDTLYYSGNIDPRIKEFDYEPYIIEGLKSRHIKVSDSGGYDLSFYKDVINDPAFLTEVFSKLKADIKVYQDSLLANGYTKVPTGNNNSAIVVGNLRTHSSVLYYYEHPIDILSYCQISNTNLAGITPIFDNSILNDVELYCSDFSGSYRTNIINSHIQYYSTLLRSATQTNFVNCEINEVKYSDLNYSNYINSYFNIYRDGNYIQWWIGNQSETPTVDKSETPSFLGTANEDIVREHTYEIDNPKATGTYGHVDLSNLAKEPIHGAHGILWKINIDGKNAYDAFDKMDPIGVGTHRFDFYFNRPMNVAVEPVVTFGVRRPYSQHKLEGGTWSADSTVYTVNAKFTGREATDGLNHIYFQSAEDNEYFAVPYDSTRFKMIVQAAGSLATGFEAKAGLGRVDLKWNNEHNDFSDAMGFNVYRVDPTKRQITPNYHWSSKWQTYVDNDTTMVTDTVRLNKQILSLKTTSFTDYDVTPDSTYQYFYKVLSTDLQEYDVSNVVAATPLTAQLGDANGSNTVDVADVITTVNYAAGQHPKPFIFEAADVNADSQIDILDVVGIIQKIVHPTKTVSTAALARATYTIEHGVVYVDSPVALAGVQVQLTTEGKTDITAAEDLNQFEQTSAWLTDNDYIFLAYNMNGLTLAPGKHALLNIGNATVSNICLSDADGHNVEVSLGNPTDVNSVVLQQLKGAKGIYNLSGQKLSDKAKDLKLLPEGVYIVNGEKVVK